MTACSKSEIDTWDARPRVWFTNSNDTTLFSFYTQPEGTTESVVEVPISMAGRVADEDRTVTVKDLGSSPFNPGSRYEIVSAVIPAGEVTGTLQVKVYKTENLEEASDTLNFEIYGSEVFEVGLSDYLHHAIIISSSLAKPSWWDSTADRYVGYYSEKKLEIIYTVLGSDEIFSSASSWWSDDVQIAIYQLNQYCKKNNIKYHPDDEDVITFDFWSN
jgi:hypothetical protein